MPHSEDRESSSRPGGTRRPLEPPRAGEAAARRLARPASSKPRRAVGRAQDAALARRVAQAFGAQLQRVRRERGWKQDAFAEALGVSRTTASNIERGEQRIFLDQVYRAASILRVPVDALLPPAHLVGGETVVHAAADAPLSRASARNLARTVEEVIREVSGEGDLNKPRQTAPRAPRPSRDG